MHLRHKRRAQDPALNWLVTMLTGHARPITGPMPGIRPRCAGLQHACSSHKRAHRRRRMAVLRIDQRQGKIEAACSRQATSARSADKVAPDSWRRGSGSPECRPECRHRYRRPPASCGSRSRLHRGEKPVDGPPGTVIQVARPMLVQFVDALRPAVGLSEPARRDHSAVEDAHRVVESSIRPVRITQSNPPELYLPRSRAEDQLRSGYCCKTRRSSAECVAQGIAASLRTARRLSRAPKGGFHRRHLGQAALLLYRRPSAVTLSLRVVRWRSCAPSQGFQLLHHPRYRGRGCPSTSAARAKLWASTTAT